MAEGDHSRCLERVRALLSHPKTTRIVSVLIDMFEKIFEDVQLEKIISFLVVG